MLVRRPPSPVLRSDNKGVSKVSGVRDLEVGLGVGADVQRSGSLGVSVVRIGIVDSV
jgi:hypothetical protein